MDQGLYAAGPFRDHYASDFQAFRAKDHPIFKVHESGESVVGIRLE